MLRDAAHRPNSAPCGEQNMGLAEAHPVPTLPVAEPAEEFREANTRRERGNCLGFCLSRQWVMF